MKKIFISMSATVLVFTMALVLPPKLTCSELEMLNSPHAKVRCGLPPVTKAKLWVEKGERYWKEKGNEGALAEFHKADGRFTRSDLILFAFDQDGGMLASGENGGPHFRDGVASVFQKELLPLALTTGEVRMQIPYMNSGSDKAERKTLHAKEMGDFILCAVVS